MILLIKSLNNNWIRLIDKKNSEKKYFLIFSNKNINISNKNIVKSQQSFEQLTVYKTSKLNNNYILVQIFNNNYQHFMKIFSREFLNHKKIDHKNFEYLYMNYLRQAYTLLISYKIETVIVPRHPHRIIDFIISIVASNLKIDLIYFDSLDQFNESNKDYCSIIPIVNNRVEYSSQNSKIKIDKGLKELIAFKLKNYRPYYFLDKNNKNQWFYNVSKDLVKLFISLVLKNIRIYKKYKILKNDKIDYANFFDYQTYHFKNTLKKIRALSFYRKNSVKSLKDIKSPYIIYFSSFIPERTTNPQGGKFSCHLQAIKYVRANINKNYTLIYKEHPSNFRYPYSFNDIDINYFREINHLKKTYLLDFKLENYELIKRSEAVYVLCGYLGIEYILRKKKTIVLGDIWFKNLNKEQITKFVQFFYNKNKSIHTNDSYKIDLEDKLENMKISYLSRIL